MEMFDVIFLVWLMHVVIGAVVSAPVIIFGRKRVHWHAWELAVFVAPFGVWLLLMFSEFSTGRKSLANLGEPFYFSLAVSIAALVRVVIGTRGDERICAWSLIVILCGVAAAVFFIVPSLPE